jgi:hypothetical protein
MKTVGAEAVGASRHHSRRVIAARNRQVNITQRANFSSRTTDLWLHEVFLPLVSFYSSPKVEKDVAPVRVKSESRMQQTVLLLACGPNIARGNR